MVAQRSGLVAWTGQTLSITPIFNTQLVRRPKSVPTMCLTGTVHRILGQLPRDWAGPPRISRQRADLRACSRGGRKLRCASQVFFYPIFSPQSPNNAVTCWHTPSASGDLCRIASNPARCTCKCLACGASRRCYRTRGSSGHCGSPTHGGWHRSSGTRFALGRGERYLATG